MTSSNYPTADPGVVAVGVVNQSGQVRSDSNSGAQLTLTAPGVGIVRATNASDTSYGKADGTSDATAYVSAEAALSGRGSPASRPARSSIG